MQRKQTANRVGRGNTGKVAESRSGKGHSHAQSTCLGEGAVRWSKNDSISGVGLVLIPSGVVPGAIVSNS